MDQSHELRAVAGLSPDVVRKLAGQWINSAEEFLSAAASPEGRTGLQRLLGFSEADFDELAARIREIAGPDESRRIEEGVRPGGPLGSLLTEEQKERLGVDSGDTEVSEL